MVSTIDRINFSRSALTYIYYMILFFRVLEHSESGPFSQEEATREQLWCS